MKRPAVKPVDIREAVIRIAVLTCIFGVNTGFAITLGTGVLPERSDLDREGNSCSGAPCPGEGSSALQDMLVAHRMHLHLVDD